MHKRVPRILDTVPTYTNIPRTVFVRKKICFPSRLQGELRIHLRLSHFSRGRNSWLDHMSCFHEDCILVVLYYCHVCHSTAPIQRLVYSAAVRHQNGVGSGETVVHRTGRIRTESHLWFRRESTSRFECIAPNYFKRAMPSTFFVVRTKSFAHVFYGTWTRVLLFLCYPPSKCVC